jgi:hypothetical protein
MVFVGPWGAILCEVRRNQLELIPQGIRSHRIPARPAHKLRLSSAVQYSLFKQRVTADYHRRLNTPIRSYAKRHVHFTCDTSHPR